MYQTIPILWTNPLSCQRLHALNRWQIFHPGTKSFCALKSFPVLWGWFRGHGKSLLWDCVGFLGVPLWFPRLTKPNHSPVHNPSGCSSATTPVGCPCGYSWDLERRTNDEQLQRGIYLSAHPLLYWASPFLSPFRCYHCESERDVL